MASVAICSPRLPTAQNGISGTAEEPKRKGMSQRRVGGQKAAVTAIFFSRAKPSCCSRASEDVSEGFQTHHFHFKERAQSWECCWKCWNCCPAAAEPGRIHTEMHNFGSFEDAPPPKKKKPPTKKEEANVVAFSRAFWFTEQTAGGEGKGSSPQSCCLAREGKSLESN